MFSTSLIIASVISGVIEGRYVVLEQVGARQEEGSTQSSNGASSNHGEGAHRTDVMISSFAYGVISIPFTLVGASPGPPIIQAILDRRCINSTSTAVMVPKPAKNNDNNHGSSSSTTANSAIGLPHQQQQRPLQRWIRRSRNTIAQEARERNSCSNNTPISTTNSNSTTTNGTTSITTSKVVHGTASSSTIGSNTKSIATIGTDTTTNNHNYFQHIIRFYNQQNHKNCNTIIIGFKRLRILFMAAGITTGYIHYYTSQRQKETKQQGRQQNDTDSTITQTNSPSQYPAVIRFVPFPSKVYCNNSSTNQHNGNSIQNTNFTILPVTAIPPLTTTTSNNGLADNTNLSSITTNLKSFHFLNIDSNTTVLCEAYIADNNKSSSLQFPFFLPQQKCITLTQLLLSTIALQRNLQQNEEKKPFDLVRILLIHDSNNNRTTASSSSIFQLVVDHDTYTTINNNTLLIHFPHLVQYVLLSTILKQIKVNYNNNSNEEKLEDTRTKTTTEAGTKESVTDMTPAMKTNARISTPTLMLSAIDSLGKLIRTTVRDTWQQWIKIIRNTTSLTNDHATLNNTDPQNPQQTIYLFPTNESSMSTTSTSTTCANARQLWIQAFLKQHGINAVFQQPSCISSSNNTTTEENNENDHDLNNTILIFCGINDEETIGSMVKYFYFDLQKQPQNATTQEVTKTTKVICLLETNESVKLLNNLVDDDHYICCCLEDIQEEAFYVVRQYLMQDHTLTEIEKKLNEELYSFPSKV